MVDTNNYEINKKLLGVGERLLTLFCYSRSSCLTKILEELEEFRRA